MEQNQPYNTTVRVSTEVDSKGNVKPKVEISIDRGQDTEDNIAENIINDLNFCKKQVHHAITDLRYNINEDLIEKKNKSPMKRLQRED